jgi:hypothetical protein
VVDPAVVDMVAKRDGLSQEEAQQYVADTLRMVAAARDARDAAAGEPEPLIDTARAKHLRRTALARLWLRTDFEPKHRPEDIPEDDPLLLQARASKANIHPRVYVLCQVVAVPKGKELSTDELVQRAGVPAWREEARRLFDPVAKRLIRYVPEGDHEACRLLARLLPKMGPDSADVALQYQSGGFDLEACAEEAPDGSCRQRRFAEEWTEQVAKAEGPGFLEPFESRFGFHLVYVRQIEDPRALDDPQTDTFLRRLVHSKWEAAAFDEYLDRLRKHKSVKVVAPGPEPEGAGGS